MNESNATSAIADSPTADSAIAGSAIAADFSTADGAATNAPFLPSEPSSIAECGLTPTDLESLILKFLMSVTCATGRDIANQICLPFGIVQDVLGGLRRQLFVAYRCAATMGDYTYELSDEGARRAKHHLERSTYFGSAPVSLDDYSDSVHRQALRNYRVNLQSLSAALGDMIHEPLLLLQVGQAINSGKGLFLYGPPGNGKTSIAERVMRACQEDIWIPRAISVTGELIRIFDPNYHVPSPAPKSDSLLNDGYDRRWIRVRRPTVVVGGELTMEHLEISTSAATGVNEAPVQLKSNCGALVVDDFGRQRMSCTEILNRWIVPLEKRFDHLTLQSGRQICVPFEQLLVFATNLAPKDVADEAFLRRMPYKMEMKDPTVEQFSELTRRTCESLGIVCHEQGLQHLLHKHYQEKNRPLRFCHPRDLMEQVYSFCEFQQIPAELTERSGDVAAYNYFAGL